MQHAIVTTGRFESPNRIILDEYLTEAFSTIRIIIEPLAPRPKHRKAGALKGLIEVMPDFDEPLDDFQEYSIKKLQNDSGSSYKKLRCERSTTTD